MGLNFKKIRFRKEMGRNWFSNTVVDEWNSLSGHVVRGESIGSFNHTGSAACRPGGLLQHPSLFMFLCR